LWDIKETCKLALDYKAESAELREKGFDFKLPDGKVVQLGDETLSCAEVVFHPQEAGKDVPGIHKLVQTAIDSCPMDTRDELYNNIVVSGGNTLWTNFQDRFKQELENAVPGDRSFKVVCAPERGISVWLGAAIIAKMSQFSNRMYVTRAQFNEDGEHLVAYKMSVS